MVLYGKAVLSRLVIARDTDRVGILKITAALIVVCGLVSAIDLARHNLAIGNTTKT